MALNLSESDLRALAAGNTAGMSTAGLQALGAYNENSQGQEHTSSVSAGEIPPLYDPSEGGGTVQVGFPPLTGSLDTHIPTSQGVQRVLSGTGQGLTNVGRHAGNLVDLESDQELADAKKTDAPLLNTGAGKFGSIIGETVATAPIGYGVGGGLVRTGLAAKGIGAIGRGAIEGATQGTLLADPGQRAKGALFGSALGSLVPASFVGAKKLATGITPTPEAARLLARGADLTPGQLNPDGGFNSVEEALQSVPFLGDSVKEARQNANNSVQKIAADSASLGGNVKQGDAASMLDQAYKSFAPIYDDTRLYTQVQPKIVGNTDVPLTDAFKSVVNSRSIVATPNARKRAAAILQNELGRTGGGASLLLDMRSSIRDAVRNAKNSPETLQRDTANLLEAAEKKITDALNSQLPADASQALAKADAKYADYAVLQDAVAKAKDKIGGFTPNDLSEAVAANMKGQNQGAYARGGGGDLRQIAADAKASLQSRSPATGARLLAIPGAPVIPPLLALIGTKTGRRLAAGLTNPQQAIQRVASKTQQQIPEEYQRLINAYTNRGVVAAGGQ